MQHRCSYSGTPLLWTSSLVLFPEHVFKGANVRNPFFVPGNNDFGSFRNRAAAFTTRAGHMPGTTLGEDQFTGAVWPDRNRRPSKHADHVVVGWVERYVIGQQHFRDEPEHNRRSAE